MKAFIESQFNYCPLIWMLRSRALNNKINHIHERALRTVYSNYNSSFYKLLKVNETIPFDLRMRNELYAQNPKILICGTETTFFLSP